MAWTGQFTIWAKWAPPLERSKLTSIAGSGEDAWQTEVFRFGHIGIEESLKNHGNASLLFVNASDYIIMFSGKTRAACKSENTYVKNRSEVLATPHLCVQHKSIPL